MDSHIVPASAETTDSCGDSCYDVATTETIQGKVVRLEPRGFTLQMNEKRLVRCKLTSPIEESAAAAVNLGAFVSVSVERSLPERNIFWVNRVVLSEKPPESLTEDSLTTGLFLGLERVCLFARASVNVTTVPAVSVIIYQIQPVFEVRFPGVGVYRRQKILLYDEKTTFPMVLNLWEENAGKLSANWIAGKTKLQIFKSIVPKGRQVYLTMGPETTINTIAIAAAVKDDFIDRFCLSEWLYNGTGATGRETRTVGRLTGLEVLGHFIYKVTFEDLPGQSFIIDYFNDCVESLINPVLLERIHYIKCPIQFAINMDNSNNHITILKIQ